MLCRRCDLCSRRNKKINIVLGEREGGKCFQDSRKYDFTAKRLNTFVARCHIQCITYLKCLPSPYFGLRVLYGKIMVSLFISTLI